MNKDLQSYQMDKYLSPIWQGDTVYAETACILQDKFGVIRPIRLAYAIKQIISVKSFNLKKTYVYGKDYTVNEYGELIILPTGDIPFIRWDDFRSATLPANDIDRFFSADGIGSYKFGELFATSDGMSEFTIAVSYTHEINNYYDIVPSKAEKVLPIINKLNSKQNLTVASYGDSITYGWAASGMQDINKPPYCPKYADMVVEYLQAKFGILVEHKNFSVSGMTTNWAVQSENLQPVINCSPNLVILAFGMNDAGVIRPEDFYKNVTCIINKIRDNQPIAQFLLVSPMYPNKNMAFTAGSSIYNYHGEYPRVFSQIEKEYSGVVCANVTAMHQELLHRKNFRDLSSNNVNHPNDFMHRIYAQVVLKTLLGNKFTI